MKRLLITGGAGFIGVNAAEYFGRRGWQITILDNLSRKGGESNLQWLRERVGFSLLRADVRDGVEVDACVRETQPDVVLHLAAQVAVTTSLEDPIADFDTNARGTVNVLEAVRRAAPAALLVFASTNKVYGDLLEMGVREAGTRWELAGTESAVSEETPLSFHSPYGCSKGAADQYVLDYARSYGLRATSMRQSCIYGPRQFGIEDQGWVAWFVIATALGRGITVYGDGKQVRDVLYVTDLCEAYEAAFVAQDKAAGQVFNIGGGLENSISLVEFLEVLRQIRGSAIDISYAPWRRGDQKYFVSDNAKAQRVLGWSPKTSVRSGVAALVDWVKSNQNAIRAVLC